MAQGPTPNKFLWNELATTDAAKCKAFYGQLFGWAAVDQPMGPTTYTRFQKDAADVGGMLQMTAEWGGVRPHWMPYVAVEDVDACARRAAELGGKACVPPTDISVGRFAVLEDPTGAVFSVIKMKE
jgi:predicted enzyme related to lactoylglutathione lyase